MIMWWEELSVLMHRGKKISAHVVGGVISADEGQGAGEFTASVIRPSFPDQSVSVHKGREGHLKSVTQPFFLKQSSNLIYFRLRVKN